MTNNEFRAWLNGYFTLVKGDMLDKQKVYIIGNHLNLVKAVDGSLDECNQDIFELVHTAFKEPTSENLMKAQTEIPQLLKKAGGNRFTAPDV